MPSNIDPSKPIYGTPTTQSVRDNFQFAHDEINDLQSKTTLAPFLPLGGGIMTGDLVLKGDPTANLQPATKQYVDNLAFGGGGGGGFSDAPLTGLMYARGGGKAAPAVSNDWFSDPKFTSVVIADTSANTLFSIRQDATYNTYGMSAVDNSVIRYNKTTKKIEFVINNAAPALSLGQTSNTITGATTFTSSISVGNLAFKGYGGQVHAINFNSISRTLMLNAYLDTDGTTYKYYNNGFSGLAQVENDGTFAFYIAPSGTADTACTWPIVLKINQNNTLNFSYNIIANNCGSISSWNTNAVKGMGIVTDNNGSLCFAPMDSNGQYIGASGMYLNNNYLTVGGQINIGADTRSNFYIGPYGSNNGRLLNFDSNIYIMKADANADLIIQNGSGYLFMQTANGSAIVQADGNFALNRKGWQPGGGVWGDTSDARIKVVQGNYRQGLAEIVQLKPVRYNFKGNVSIGGVSRHEQVTNKQFIGLVAQDVEPIMPECITWEEGEIDGRKVSDLRMMDLSPLQYAFINAFKEVDKRLRALERQEQ